MIFTKFQIERVWIALYKSLFRYCKLCKHFVQAIVRLIDEKKIKKKGIERGE